MALRAGSRLGSYEVLAPLGAGGMGEVYRARDLKLGREVALKVLPEAFARNPSRVARFEREARALAALSHPGIATIHGFEEADGIRFLVLELVPGQTLAARLQGGRLPLPEALEIGARIAGALAAAHAHGIVHRDLKPSNVQVTPEGAVKLLDFGLAKALGETPTGSLPSDLPTEAAPVTAEGAVLGTAAYMSPEQARGQPLDERTDVWALGCVLYEALTGTRAFPGPTVPDTVAAVLEREPDWQALPEATPAAVRSLLGRCLRKEPARRLHDVEDARIELEEAGVELASASGASGSGRRRHRGADSRLLFVGALVLGLVLATVAHRWFRSNPAPGIRSLAVLPLQSLSGDASQEYLADGMTEELISRLGAMTPLRVISRTSVMPYKTAPESVPKIAAELGVDAVVEGSVQRSGDLVQITARLIEASTEKRLWAHTYQRDFAGVLALESEVAGAIAHEISAEVEPGKREPPPVARTTVPKASEAYLLGLYHLRQPDPQSVPKAIASFQKAIGLDPDFALAHAGLANAYRDLGTYFMQPPREAFTRSEEAATRALQLDPTLAEAHASLAFTRADGDWDWKGAESSFRRAIELNDSYAYAHEQYGMFLVLMGRTDQGLGELRKAVRLDPLGLSSRLSLGAGLYQGRRYDESIRELRGVLERDPDLPQARALLSLNHVAQGLLEDAIAESERAVEGSGRLPLYLSFLGYAHALAGERSRAREILRELEARRSEVYVDPAAVALVYAGLREWDEALSWVERAYQDHSDGLVYAKVAPFLDPLRNQPRFEAVLRRMAFPQT